MGRCAEGAVACSGCCACFLCGLIMMIPSLMLSGYLFWIYFRTFTPSISIEMFEVPALNKTSNGAFNIIDPTITFDLRLKNENLNEGVFYDNVNVTLSYYHANISKFSPIGNKARRVESIQSYGVPWDIAKLEVLNGSTTTFRVDVNTRIKIRHLLALFFSVNTQRTTLDVGVNIPVNDQGIKSVKKGLRMSID
ncbi:hypothetical protein MKW98_032533 [Papaver atlanticum]|uniref:Late embryogenesis abundant protein LEA-2 subgroup domain-containing protein n=1 Tax=Papaver atlanticum TaxID=357466 RepID=A0AAD4SUL8_9MAGN|nr:hypothetical protein MKW98_032533 [Papaver atlanticum]